ncbi:Gfo/Idh/MocA family protein [Rubrolithibacter danxiaensis]|uniref:Gfo/Idh/MocA family protein n=1 Tax=Rubrolithibacter danxiaensis TaxID=3390805 RepID=UPI003BF78113
METINRRDFIGKAIIAGAGLALTPHLSFADFASKKARIAFIGVGLRGTNHLSNMLHRKDVEIPAICDIDPVRIGIAQDLIAKAGFKKAAVYSKNEHSFLDLLKRDDIDGVIISTPWEWHTPMAVAAMKAGKYAGVEVSAANTVEECWDLVNTSEKTGSHCMILENVCYRRDVMAVLNMVRQNLFGELTHCQCGYQHDLRGVKFEPGAEFGEKGIHEAHWRTEHSVKRNGDLYPTHGIGPIANCLNINRGNSFVSLTSVATKSRGLHNYIIDKGGKDHPNANVKFKLGDIVSTLIQTSNGETILVTHDTNSPRPYSLGFRVQGTKGLWMDDGNVIYIEGKSKNDEWESATKYLEQYDHPLWKRYADDANGAGHGGMDFFVLNAFVESVKRKVAPPLDVYDAAAWSVISPLSEMSIANGGAPQQFPDFTRGKWKDRKPVFGFTNEY